MPTHWLQLITCQAALAAGVCVQLLLQCCLLLGSAARTVLAAAYWGTCSARHASVMVRMRVLLCSWLQT